MTPTAVLFLDVDGVLNGHEKMSNHYSRMRPDSVNSLNLILRATGCNLVLSSAWRYPVLSNDMSLEGLKGHLMSHGVDCWTAFAGCTVSDEEIAGQMGKPRADFSDMSAWHCWVKEHGCAIRRTQIYRYVEQRPEIVRFVVLDDLNLQMPELVQTNGDWGLTKQDVTEVISRLQVAQ